MVNRSPATVKAAREKKTEKQEISWQQEYKNTSYQQRIREHKLTAGNTRIQAINREN